MPSDSELQDLTADIAPAAGDVVYVVIDPAGTPLARRMTVENLLKAVHLLSELTTADAETDKILVGNILEGTWAKYITPANLMKAWFLDSEGNPADVVTLTSADGTSTYAARRDHVHAPALIRHVCIEVVDKDTALTTGDGKKAFHIPPDITGYNLVYVHMFCLTASSNGIPTIQVRNQTDTQDMLSTKLTIDQGETDSKDAAAPAVIDTTKDDVVTNDIIALDCDVAGTGTKGLYVTLGFQKP